MGPDGTDSLMVMQQLAWLCHCDMLPLSGSFSVINHPCMPVWRGAGSHELLLA
jgi:hypothetical protein